MALTLSPLDRSNRPLSRDAAQLLLIDVQIGHLDAIQTIPPDRLRRNVVALTQIAGLYGLPVLLTGSRQRPPEGTFLPEVTELLPEQPVIERSTSNAWDTPEVVDAVVHQKRRQLILAGVALDIGVLLPALAARTAGYEVTVVMDATGTTDSRVEAAAMMRLASAHISLTSLAAVGMELQHDLSLPPAPDLMAVIASTIPGGHSPFDEGR